MGFKEIALSIARRGIPVIPVLPGEKRCVLHDWPARATTDEAQILKWDRENPLFNVGCVGKPDGVVILDCDVKGLMKRIEQETGREFPPTLVVRSGGKGAGHVYFRQNEWSRAPFAAWARTRFAASTSAGSWTKARTARSACAWTPRSTWCACSPGGGGATDCSSSTRRTPCATPEPRRRILLKLLPEYPGAVLQKAPKGEN